MGGIFLGSIKQIEGRKQGVGGHIGREGEMQGESASSFFASRSARKAVPIQICFGDAAHRLWGGAVGEGEKQFPQKVRLHPLHAQGACLAAFLFAVLLALDAGDEEMDDLILGENAAEKGTDLPPAAVGVGENDHAEVPCQAA